MVEYIRKFSKRVGDQVVVVDTTDQVGMRTRVVAAAAVAVAVAEEGAEKRRKVGDGDGNGELRLPLPKLVQITSPEDIRDPCATAAVNRSCDHVQVSCCSRNESTKDLQFTDLEEIVEIEAVTRCNLDTRARKSRSEIKVEQETVTAKPSTVINSRRTIPAEKIPPADELEEFFASAETELHKRFKDKYNYDIVNDTPLEGRFQWVQVKP